MTAPALASVDVRPHPEDVTAIPIEQIDASGRLRPVDPDWAAAIAASFEERGQDTAIEVRPLGDGYRLTAGAHRLAAAALLGWPTIRAMVVARSDDEARLVEIEENLLHSGLIEIDRIRFLYERKLVKERMYPETRQGAAAKGKNKVANLATFPRRFTAEAAEKFGLGERTVQRACQIAEALGPDMLERLRGTPLADNQAHLIDFARHTDEERREILAAFEADQPVTSYRAALQTAGLRAVDDSAEDKRQLAVATWERWDNATRRYVLLRAGFAEDVIDAVIPPDGRRRRA